MPTGCSVESGPGGDWAAHYNRRKMHNLRYDVYASYTTVTEPFYPDPSKMIDMTGASMSPVMGTTLVAENCLEDSGFPGSQCHTINQSRNFWMATTPGNQPFRITAVVVRNRQNCLGTSAAPRAHFRAFGPLATLSPRGRTLIHARARTRPRT